MADSGGNSSLFETAFPSGRGSSPVSQSSQLTRDYDDFLGTEAPWFETDNEQSQLTHISEDLFDTEVPWLETDNEQSQLTHDNHDLLDAILLESENAEITKLKSENERLKTASAVSESDMQRLVTENAVLTAASAADQTEIARLKARVKRIESDKALMHVMIDFLANRMEKDMEKTLASMQEGLLTIRYASRFKELSQSTKSEEEMPDSTGARSENTDT